MGFDLVFSKISNEPNEREGEGVLSYRNNGNDIPEKAYIYKELMHAC